MRVRILAAEDGVQPGDVTLPRERIEVVRHGHQVRFRRQLVGRVPPVTVGEYPELSTLDESTHALLHVREVPGRGARVTADRLGKGRGGLRVRLQRRDHVHPVERVQVIEMHDVVVHVLRADHQVADEVCVLRNLPAQRIFDGAHRCDAVHQRADTADALREGPCVARVAPAQDDLETPHHGAGAVGLRNAAVCVGGDFNPQVPLDVE